MYYNNDIFNPYVNSHFECLCPCDVENDGYGGGVSQSNVPATFVNNKDFGWSIYWVSRKCPGKATLKARLSGREYSFTLSNVCLGPVNVFAGSKATYYLPDGKGSIAYQPPGESYLFYLPVEGGKTYTAKDIELNGQMVFLSDLGKFMLSQ